MTVDEVREFLKRPNKVFKLAALSYVSLGELEADIIYLRYFMSLTQEKTAERLPKVYEERLGISEEEAIQQYTFSTNGIQKIEKRALEKCAEVWSSIVMIKEILKAAQ